MPIKKDDVSFTYDVSKHLKGVPEDDREDAAYEAGEAALQKIQEYMDKERSPVKGERGFPKLNKDYAAFKQSKVGNKKPNLLLNGDLVESMEVESDDESFTISVEGSTNKLKAYNHNVGDTLPKRQFLPDDTRKQELKADVVKAIKQAINRYKKPAEERPAEAVAPVEITTSEYEKLFATFQATKREQSIAKNLSLFKIEDIL